jgi:Arf-GAP with GTPase, ANK repeat and PH domain-containing protein 1/3/4/5/6/9/11
MLSIGNSLANSIWERNTHGRKKPTPASSREDKEKWIKSKYESKSFLPTCDFSTRRIEQQLVEAVAE